MTILPFTRKTACLVNSCYSLNAKDAILSAHLGLGKDLNNFVHTEASAKMFDRAGGNTGNSVIGYSIFKALASAGIRVIANYPTIPESEKDWDGFLRILGTVDHVVLCLQDLIRPDANSIWTASFFVNLERLSSICSGKLCVVSLGSNNIANSTSTSREILGLLPENVLNAVAKLVDSASYIQTRDSELAEVLQDYSKASNVKLLPPGCPSFLWKTLSNERLRKSITRLYDQNKLSKILVGGLYGSRSLEAIGKLCFIAQEEIEMLPNDFLFDSGSATHLHPYYIHAATHVYVSKSVKCFFHPYDWLRFLRRQSFSLYIGTRLHGGIVALMSGVPAVFTSGDQRVARFASTFALPHCPQGLLVEDASNILMNWDYEHTVKLQNNASKAFINSLANMR